MLESLHFLKNMRRIRRLEEKAAELYGAMKIRGYLHLYVGQEAVAAGAVPVFSLEDGLITTYRDHGHALMRGISARSIMAEMYGKVEGCSRGRGGSMHLFDAKLRFFGGSGVVAAGMPIALGLALADKLQKRHRITGCFFGEGAIAEGEFHECVNLAALWHLPVLFLCENNQYAMGTAISRELAQTNLARKMEGYGVPFLRADGMRVASVNEAVKAGYETVKKEGGPFFIELSTYRFRAHSMFDPELYRSRAEVEEWKKQDPILLEERRLLEAGLLEASQLGVIEQEVAAEIEDAVSFAEQGNWEPLADLERFVFWERAAA